MILLLAACIACLVGSVGFYTAGVKHAKKVSQAHAEQAHESIVLKAKHVHKETKLVLAEAKEIRMEANDALLAIRQCAQEHVVLANQSRSLVQQANQIMNDRRVLHALRSSNG